MEEGAALAADEESAKPAAGEENRASFQRRFHDCLFELKGSFFTVYVPHVKDSLCRGHF